MGEGRGVRGWEGLGGVERVGRGLSKGWKKGGRGAARSMRSIVRNRRNGGGNGGGKCKNKGRDGR